MYGLIGQMMAVPGQRDALIEIVLVGSRGMAGCLSYIVAKDALDADTVWITEVWDAEASHAASVSLPSVREANRRGEPLIAAFGQGMVTEPVGGLVPVVHQ